MPIWDFSDIANETLDELFAEGKIPRQVKVVGVVEFAHNEFRITFDLFAVADLRVRLIPGRSFKLCVRDAVLSGSWKPYI
jgi:hypothetical protein